MRRAWWLGVLMVACDFDAAYERRCDAGGCPSFDAGSAGGQGGGGATAGGQGGGATAGGQSGGASCPTPLTLELNVMTPSPISATACVHLDIALKCGGVRLDAGVPIQVRATNTSNALGRPGTLFNDPNCGTSPLFHTTGDVYFDSTAAGQSYMFGLWEIRVEAGDAGVSRRVQLEPSISGSPPMVLLPTNTCVTLPPISFVGLNDTVPVLAPAPQRFTGVVPAPLIGCGATEVLVDVGQSMSSVTPGVRAAFAAPAGSGFTLYSDAGHQVTYQVRPCIDGGTAAFSGECCVTSGGNLLTDGGYSCP